MALTNLELIYCLSSCKFGRFFLSKSYSLELLFFLYSKGHADGVDHLYNSLRCSTPQKPAFISYLNYLESMKCIHRVRSESKGSMRKVLLTNDCRKAIGDCIEFSSNSDLARSAE